MITAKQSVTILVAVGATRIEEGRMTSDLVYWSRGMVGVTPIHMHDHDGYTVLTVGGYAAIVAGSDAGAVEYQVRRLLEVA